MVEMTERSLRVKRNYQEQNDDFPDNNTIYGMAFYATVTKHYALMNIIRLTYYSPRNTICS